MPVDPEDLVGLELFEGADGAQLDRVARRLTGRSLPADCRIIRQGDTATTFALVVDGELVVTRDNGDGPEELAVVGPGSIVGELALVRGKTRVASVTTRTDTRVLTGNREALVTLLRVPAVAERLRDLVSLRLAEDADPVPVRTADGTEYVLRPLRPDDGAGLQDGLDRMSDESLYRRFFTGGRPGEMVIEHLLDVDYLDHFAWVVGEPDGVRGVAIARYQRLADDPLVAEAAWTVIDEHQGRGLGTLLLGALATAAAAAGIQRLKAEVLSDNRPMRAVLAKADATWSSVEPGVVETEVDVGRARAVLDEDTVRRIEAAVREIVTAAGLALAHRTA
jgi:CRP-like cAMP-binding protein